MKQLAQNDSYCQLGYLIFWPTTYIVWSWANMLWDTSVGDSFLPNGANDADKTSPWVRMQRQALRLFESRTSQRRAVWSSDPLNNKLSSSVKSKQSTDPWWPWYFVDCMAASTMSLEYIFALRIKGLFGTAPSVVGASDVLVFCFNNISCTCFWVVLEVSRFGKQWRV